MRTACVPLTLSQLRAASRSKGIRPRGTSSGARPVLGVPMPHANLEKRRAYMRKYHKVWRALPHIKARKKYERFRYLLRKSYGLSVQTYEAMSSAQGGLCAVCHEACKTYPRLSVDHCHSSGRVRGLLCANCNVALGMLHEDPERIDALARYMRSFAANP